MLTIRYDKDGAAYSDFGTDEFLLEMVEIANKKSGNAVIHTSTENVMQAARALALEQNFDVEFIVFGKTLTPNRYGAIHDWPQEYNNNEGRYAERIIRFAMKERDKVSIEKEIFGAIDKWIGKPDNEIIKLLVNEPGICSFVHAKEWLLKRQKVIFSIIDRMKERPDQQINFLENDNAVSDREHAKNWVHRYRKHHNLPRYDYPEITRKTKIQ